MSIGEDMVRVSVGVEDFEDIRNDFEQAISLCEVNMKLIVNGKEIVSAIT